MRRERGKRFWRVPSWQRLGQSQNPDASREGAKDTKEQKIMNNIMLDLETLGSKPGAVIVAIGAVRFGGGMLGAEFYRRVNAESCVRLGLQMDVSTVLWWMKQKDDARLELTKPGAELAEAISDFSHFCSSRPSASNVLWGNGSDFDNAILSRCYEVCGHNPPWQFWNNRCYRTVKNLHPQVAMTRTGTAHNALEDAKSQALHLMQMLPKL